MGGTILVGVDGSETAKMAARWAAREAELRGAKIKLVTAWEIPVTADGYGFAIISDDLMRDLAKVAEDHLAATEAEVRSQSSKVQIEAVATQGQAARVLLDASREADLLVVGSRGLGGFRELLLGSVSQQCAHHSACPVVIVRHLHGDA